MKLPVVPTDAMTIHLKAHSLRLRYRERLQGRTRVGRRVFSINCIRRHGHDAPIDDTENFLCIEIDDGMKVFDRAGENVVNACRVETRDAQESSSFFFRHSE